MGWAGSFGASETPPHTPAEEAVSKREGMEYIFTPGRYRPISIATVTGGTGRVGSDDYSIPTARDLLG